MPGAALGPKESKSALEVAFALWTGGSAGLYVPGRTPSAVLPTGSEVLPLTLGIVYNAGIPGPITGQLQHEELLRTLLIGRKPNLNSLLTEESPTKRSSLSPQPQACTRAKELEQVSQQALSSHGTQGREEACQEGGQEGRRRQGKEGQEQGRVLQDLHLQGLEAGKHI